MCGIVAFSGQTVIPESRVEQSLAQIEHRGPDDSGIFRSDDQTTALGNRRLSIVDLTDAGQMPMTNREGTVSITYNGEIYNYVELREELESRGYSFRSDTDTEVVLKSYVEWGEDCLERLNGMWAFAIWDGRDDRLFVARDRLGIKPLYYTDKGEEFVFASEIKAIVSAAEEPPAPNYDAIRTFVETGLVDGATQTFFDGVRRVDPGSYVIIEDGEVQQTSYWELDTEVAQLEDSEGKIRDQLTDSVRLRLRSDVTNGVSLSGGLDSSSIAAFVSRNSDDAVHTFSSVYSDPEYDEREYVREVVEKYDLDSTELTPETDDFVGTISDILFHLEEPSKHYGVYSQWHVMERAAEDVKVMLDGQGADELFAGYYSFYPVYHRSLLARSKSDPKQLLRLAAERIGAARFRGGVSSVLPSWRSVLPISFRGDREEYDPFEDVLSDQLLQSAEMLQFDAFDGFDEELNNKLATATFVTSLPSLLRDEDKVSMAFSIESRVPFLDHRLVESAFQTAEDEKIHFGWTKHVLRAAVSDVLPERIAWRRDKKGYPTPLKRWISGGDNEIHSVVTSDRLEERSIISTAKMDDVYQKHVRGETDATDLIWRVLQVELWFRLFIDGDDTRQERSQSDVIVNHED